MKEVKAGDFYYGFVCKKCKRPIPMFEDPHKGRGPVKVVGEAKITT